MDLARTLETCLTHLTSSSLIVFAISSRAGYLISNSAVVFPSAWMILRRIQSAFVSISSLSPLSFLTPPRMSVGKNGSVMDAPESGLKYLIV